MKNVIYNDLIPWKGYQAITIWPCIFARNAAKYLKDYVKNHETIHWWQQLEVMLASAAILAVLIACFGWSWWWMFLSIGVYYVWYITEYGIDCIIYPGKNEGYRNVCFEQEAYDNQYDLTYLRHRKPFAWVKYIGRKTYERR